MKLAFGYRQEKKMTCAFPFPFPFPFFILSIPKVYLATVESGVNARGASALMTNGTKYFD